MRRLFLCIVILVLGGNGWLIYSAVNADHLRQTPIPTGLQEADLVLRRNGGMVSSLFASASQSENLYSHAGLIHYRNNRCMVVHTVDDVDGQSGLRCEPLEHFLNSSSTLRYALYRYPLNEAQRRVSSEIADSALRSGLPFDRNFSLDSKETMYCSEWIAYCINKASGNALQFEYSEVEGLKYLAIDNLYLNQAAQIYRSKK